MYSQYGYAVDEYDVSFQEEVAKTVVENDIDFKVIAHYAEEKGYALSEEKSRQIHEEAAKNIAQYKESYASYLQASGADKDTDVNATVEAELAAMGISEDAICAQLEQADMLEYVFNLTTAEVTVTQEDVRKVFDEKVEAEKTKYAEKDTFVTDYLSGNERFYTPEGYRLIQAVYIGKSDAEMDAAVEATPDEATAAEATAAEASPAEARDISELQGRAKAEAVLEKIQGGMDFEEAVRQYSEDMSGQQEVPVYPVSDGVTYYGESFVAGAMAIGAKGEISGVIDHEYGYFILRYMDDLKSGETEFDAVSEKLTEETLNTRKEEKFTSDIQAVLQESGIETRDLSPLYHVYVGQTSETMVAFASTAKETQMLDRPEGKKIADLLPGAALEIYGSITVNGQAYQFVEAVGTGLKGYVVKDALEVAEGETAKVADNSGLVIRSQENLTEELPIFTLVMNDGQVIYGELYPEKAPESVGNFASLANSGFYNGLIFHRVIPGFMIQGGDPEGNGTGGPEYSIKGEFAQNGVENDLSHVRGVLSMARSADFNSAGSQFFIMHADSKNLDGQYAAFGMVIEGMDTVDVIASVPVDAKDKPRTEQVIRTIFVETHGNTYEFTKIRD